MRRVRVREMDVDSVSCIFEAMIEMALIRVVYKVSLPLTRARGHHYGCCMDTNKSEYAFFVFQKVPDNASEPLQHVTISHNQGKVRTRRAPLIGMTSRLHQWVFITHNSHPP